MNQRSVISTRHMAQLALMSSIILIMSFTPLGYFRTPGLSITFLTVPVAVGAIILGPKSGAFCGLVFGITSFISCLTSGSFLTILLSINPIGVFFTCIVPRIMTGFLCGIIFQILNKINKRTSYFAASLSCPLLNTLFFMTSLVVIFYRTDYIQELTHNLGTTNPLAFVIAFVGLQGLIEAIICSFIASILSITLNMALKK